MNSLNSYILKLITKWIIDLIYDNKKYLVFNGIVTVICEILQKCVNIWEY